MKRGRGRPKKGGSPLFKKGDSPLFGKDEKGTVPTSRLDLLLEPDDGQRLANLSGPFDAHLRQIELRLGIEIRNRGNRFRLVGPETDIGRGEEVLRKLFEQAAEALVTTEQVHLALTEQAGTPTTANAAVPEADTGEIVVRTKRGVVRGRGERQREYLRDIARHDLTFGIGPAGTGKTYLAVASAVQALEQDRVRRIVLTRPAVEAGEKLGFLPGDMAQKVDPYLRPLYDALYEMLGFERVARLVERAVIEVAPLAFMRGRAQPYFSKVLTPKGWRPIGTLEPGDAVIGSDGRPTEVLGVFPRGRRPVYRVAAQDGASTLCCDEHLWTVFTPADRRHGKGPRTLETKAMVGKLRQNHQHRYELPLLNAPALFPPRHVPMDPYALGLLLGDGCITGKTTPSFTTADPELAVALEHALWDIEVRAKANSRIDHVLRHVGVGRGGLRIANPVTVTLRELQLCGASSHTKFVPQQYLYNSPEARLSVLQGLLDTDGGPVLQDGRTCRIQYTTTSPQLRDDVVFLVRSLGGVVYWRTRAAAGRKPGRARGRDVGYRHDAFVMDIRLPVGVEPFRLKRKAAAYANAGGGRPMRYIESIEPVGIQDVVCIKVAAADALYVTDDFLVTHNTLNESFVILDEAQNTSVEQMKMFLTRIGFGSVAVVTGDVTQIDLPRHQTSGLKHTMQVLDGVAGIKFVRFEKQDVVRHPLVQAIVHAYEVHEAKEQGNEK